MSAPQNGRVTSTKLVASAAGAVILGVCVIGNDLKSDGSPPQPAAVQTPPLTVPTNPLPAPSAQAAPAEQPAVQPSVTPLKSSSPLRIRIPDIEVDAPVIGLGLDASGVLQVPPPTNRNLAGWYKDGTAPGARGAAIMLGHVDTQLGPAVFWDLGALEPGARISIDRSDGKTATFEVDSVEAFEKANFPDDRVYGATPDAQLRLITCGGVYDKARRDYLSNVVVFAHLVATD